MMLLPPAIKTCCYVTKMLSLTNIWCTSKLSKNRHAQSEERWLEITREQLSVADAVSSYLFNSQIVGLSDGNLMLVAPSECYENRHIASLIDEILSDSSHSLNRVEFVDLRQSMQNGGGPACLRLRATLSPDEFQAINPECLATPEKLDILEKWVHKHYRDQLTLTDLCDPLLLKATQVALDELTQILHLGSLYDFQRN